MLLALTLYAQPAEAKLAHSDLVRKLASIGLIAAECSPKVFLTGENFFQHITFLGCAPQMNLSPEQGSDFMRVSVLGFARPQWFASKLAQSPKCTNCHKAIKDWRLRIAQAGGGQIICPCCEASLEISALPLRRRACYARNVIQIAPIFESEAQPVPLLLEQLGQEFGLKFDYCFSETVKNDEHGAKPNK